MAGIDLDALLEEVNSQPNSQLNLNSNFQQNPNSNSNCQENSQQNQDSQPSRNGPSQNRRRHDRMEPYEHSDSDEAD